MINFYFDSHSFYLIFGSLMEEFMIKYMCCKDVGIEKVYAAFKSGFSDYIVKIEMPLDKFIKHFFGPEQNSLEYSFIALDNDEPVGLILGGIKNYEGIKTIRCGTLCMNPEYRGTGISKELFKLHKQIGIENQCKQLFLEVIVGNDRAIKFYNNMGYEKIFDICYFSTEDTTRIKSLESLWTDIRKVDYKTIIELSYETGDIHTNWQNEMDYVEKLEGLHFYGAYDTSELVGGLVISPSGKIFFVWTRNSYRDKGIATSLIKRAVMELQLKKITISFPNNWRLEGYLKHMNFEREKLSQYEMYLTLK